MNRSHLNLTSLFILVLLCCYQISIIDCHLLQALKNLKALTFDQLRLGKISNEHSVSGYLSVSYYNDNTRCLSNTLNSVYYYKLNTCLRTGDPNANSEFVTLTLILKENQYHLQWTYYSDYKCSSIVGYPNGGKLMMFSLFFLFFLLSFFLTFFVPAVLTPVIS
jgi:hypothetical protein